MMYVHGPSLHKLKRDGAASSSGRPRINPRSRKQENRPHTASRSPPQPTRKDSSRETTPKTEADNRADQACSYRTYGGRITSGLD